MAACSTLLDRSFHSLLAVILAMLIGCAATQSSVPLPDAIPEAQQGTFCGSIAYRSTNTEYLPLSLRHVREGASAEFIYEYEVKYGVEDDTMFDLFNPALIVGAPKSKDSVFVLARLTVKTTSGFEKHYEDAISLTKSTRLFSEGDTLSEVRRKGLIGIRNKIDAMLQRDAPLRALDDLVCKWREIQ